MPDAIDSVASRRRPDDDPSADLCTSVLAPQARPAPCMDDALVSSVADGPVLDYSAALKNPSLRDSPLLPPGIELASIATPPTTSRNDPSRTIHAAPYDLHAEMKANADGSSSVAYFAAYNKDSQRLEYIVKPEAVPDFAANVTAFKVGANVTMMNGGPTREYQKESIRAVDSVMRGNLADAVRHGALAYREAVTDPAWYTDVAMGLATGGAGELTRATPLLRLVSEEAGAEIPTVARLAPRAMTETPLTLVSLEGAPAVEGSLARAASPALAPTHLSLVASNPHPVVLTPPPLAAMAAPIVMGARNVALGGALAVAPRAVSKTSGGDTDDVDLSCVPRPLGWHRGGDAVHNDCSDAMGNLFPGSDVVVGGLAFDGLLTGNALLETKTGLASKYRGAGPIFAFRDWTAKAREESKVAARCGYTMVLAVADPDAIHALQKAFARDENITVVAADKDECVR